MFHILDIHLSNYNKDYQLNTMDNYNLITIINGINIYLGNIRSRNLLPHDNQDIVMLVLLNNYEFNNTDIYYNFFAFKYISIFDNEKTNIIDHFDDTYKFISKFIGKKHILFHCGAGRSRSAAFLIAFLIRHFKIKYNAAFDTINAVRHICPNDGFRKQLELYAQLN